MLALGALALLAMTLPKADINVSKSVRVLSVKSDKLRRSCDMGYVDSDSPDLVAISGKDNLELFCSALKSAFSLDFECSNI